MPDVLTGPLSGWYFLENIYMQFHSPAEAFRRHSREVME
jgi:hypothetical protein